MSPPPAKKAKPAPKAFMQRIQREVKDAFQSNIKKLGYKLEMVPGDDLTNLRGEIFGSVDTPYETGHFVLDIKVPPEYPYKPPEIKFATPIWHPNVSSVTGAICLDILKDKWSVMLNLRTVMVSIQGLMSEPVPDDPQDGVVAGQYLRNKVLFEKTAQHWTRKFAKGEKRIADFEKMESELMALGFPAEKVIVQLSNNDWDVAKATNSLLDP